MATCGIVGAANESEGALFRDLCSTEYGFGALPRRSVDCGRSLRLRACPAETAMPYQLNARQVREEKHTAQSETRLSHFVTSSSPLSRTRPLHLTRAIHNNIRAERMPEPPPLQAQPPLARRNRSVVCSEANDLDVRFADKRQGNVAQITLGQGGAGVSIAR